MGNMTGVDKDKKAAVEPPKGEGDINAERNSIKNTRPGQRQWQGSL